MDEARSVIVSQVAKLGLSLSELSLSVGKNHAYFQQFVKRGVPRWLPEEVRGRVAKILNVDERILKPPDTNLLLAAPKPNADYRGAVKITTWIPVYGQAVGGKDGEFILNGNQVSEVLAPSSLSSVPNAYAVYVVGDSMEPRYFAGETVFVNPRLPISRGAFVVAQISGGEETVPHAYIKRFVSQELKASAAGAIQPKKGHRVSQLKGRLDPPYHFERGK